MNERVALFSAVRPVKLFVHVGAPVWTMPKKPTAISNSLAAVVVAVVPVVKLVLFDA